MRKIVFCLSLLFVSSIFATDAVEQKIAVVDIQKVLTTAPQVAAIKTKLQNQFDPQSKEITELQKQLQSDVDKYTKDNAVMKDKEKKDFQDKVAAEQKKLRDMEVSFQQNLVNAQNQSMQTILKQIQDVVESMAKKQKYELVLVKGAVLYSDATLDITDQVVAALKK